MISYQPYNVYTIKHTVLLHDRKELDNDLGGRADHDLALTTALSVVDGVQAVVQNRDTDHVI